MSNNSSFDLPAILVNNSGEKLTFNTLTIRDGKEYLEGVNEVQPNAGPPMHVHYRQEEGLTILYGRMGYQVQGEEKKYAGPGETVIFKAGIPHKFWNAGNDVLRCTAYITPADNVIYFLTQLFQSSNENGGRPLLYDAAYLLKRYQSEFGMLEIPSFVQKFLFPIVLFFGNLMGKDKKFINAPAPII